ncbi:MAG TPA: S8 family serine peptidase, partial [Acidimicrobiia bacterium]
QANAPPVAFDGDYVDTTTYGAIGRDDNPQDPGDWRDVTPARDSSWHGTGMAGLINDVAPGASIQPIRALSWRGGLLSDIAASITWASGGTIDNVPVNANPSKVINLSFAVEAMCPVALQDAIDGARERGSILIAAAGNASDDASKFAPGNCNGVITVGSTTSEGTRADYSNHGPVIDISAPGGNTSTPVSVASNTGTTAPDQPSTAGDFGTSVSASHVAAGAAILAATNPSITPDEAYTTLTGRDYTKAFANEICDTANPDYTCGTGILTLAQPATISSGDQDYAMTFNGTNQLAIAPDNSAFDLTGAFTIEAWVKPTNCNGIGPELDTFIRKFGAYTLGCGADDGVFAYQVSNTTWVPTEVPVQDGAWQHIALTKAEGSNTPLFYLNGQLAFTGSAIGNAPDNSNEFRIGTQRQATVIDEVRLWDTSRTQPEIVADMHTYGPILTNGSATPGLVAYYDFNEGPAGTTGTGTVYNRADNAAAGTNLRTVNGPTYTDVKQTTSNGNNTVITFPRSYLTAAGGWRVPEGVSSADVLVVAGGGGGGSSFDGAGAGGGGAGGLIYRAQGEPDGRLTVSPGDSERVVVGAGGLGGSGDDGWVAGATSQKGSYVESGLDGQNSVFGDLDAAVGGGGGGGRASPGLVGGSGGGAGGRTGNAGGLRTTDQGSEGGTTPTTDGNDTDTWRGGAGGGGYASAGLEGSRTDSGGAGGAGGAGRSITVSSSSATYSVGGGGGDRTPDGGANTSGADGVANTGNGGEGASVSKVGYASGGFGGSGVVIVSFSTEATGACTPEETQFYDATDEETYRVVAFKDTGSCTWTVPDDVELVDYLVVGGGGGGGGGGASDHGGGGGGAGGLVEGTNLDVSAG